MNKKQKLLVLVFLFFLLFVAIIDYDNKETIRVDSGWDTSYDYGGSWDSGSSWDSGGSWDSGSSWDSGGSWDYGGSSSSSSSGGGGYYDDLDPSFARMAISMTIICLVIGLLITVYTVGKAEYDINKIYEEADENSPYHEFMKNYDEIMKNLEKNTVNTEISEETLQRFLPKENTSELKNKLFKLFVDIQNAWMMFDYNKLKELCSDELANTYIAQLDALKIKNGRNVMKEFVLDIIRLNSITENDGVVTISVFLETSFYDYVIDQKTKKVIRGTDSRKVKNSYKLDFIIEKEIKIDKCPNCGAKIKHTTSGKCEYCNSDIVTKPKNFVLCKKQIISSRNT